MTTRKGLLEAAAREAIKELPPSIRVGAYDYSIEVMSSLASGAKNRWGESSPMELTIRIREDFPCPIHVSETFIHELHHAMYYVFSIESGDDEERTSSQLATGWACIFRDNPWFLAWLAKWTARGAD